MGRGVVVAPAPLSGRRRAGPAVVAVVIVAALALALAKPWGSAPAGSSVLSLPPNLAAGQAQASVRASIAPTDPPPAWPAEATTLPLSGSATTIQGAAALFVRWAGAWGVGAGGAGPRLIRDEIWADWVAVTPRPVAARPQLTPLPSGQLCTGVPTLVDRPSVVAVTAPAGLPPAAWHLVGWWSDGGPSIPVDTSVRQVAVEGALGISVLERVDQATWPSGRYEFHLSAGRSTVSLAVCLDATL